MQSEATPQRTAARRRPRSGAPQCVGTADHGAGAVNVRVEVHAVGREVTPTLTVARDAIAAHR